MSAPRAVADALKALSPFQRDTLGTLDRIRLDVPFTGRRASTRDIHMNTGRALQRRGLIVIAGRAVRLTHEGEVLAGYCRRWMEDGEDWA